MKKMWKQMAMALIGIGTVLSVSACGGKENTTSNEPQTTANVAESEAKTELKVALWDYTNAKYFKNLIEEFEKIMKIFPSRLLKSVRMSIMIRFKLCFLAEMMWMWYLQRKLLLWQV